MRRIVTLGAAIALTVINTGCLAVVSTKSLSSQQRQAVVLDGEVYIVDLSGKNVVKVDPATVANAEVVKVEIDVSDED